MPDVRPDFVLQRPQLPSGIVTQIPAEPTLVQSAPESDTPPRAARPRRATLSLVLLLLTFVLAVLPDKLPWRFRLSLMDQIGFETFFPFVVLIPFVAAWLLAPASWARRIGACAIALIGYALWLSEVFAPFSRRVGYGDSENVAHWVGLALAAALGAWLLVRARRGISTLFVLIPALIGAIWLLFDRVLEKWTYLVTGLDPWLAVRDALLLAIEVLIDLTMLASVIVAAVIAARMKPAPPRVRATPLIPTEPQLTPMVTADGQTVYVQVAPTTQQPATNTLALVGFIAAFFVGIVGIVLGHIALKQTSQTGQHGRGLAIAALVIGYVGTSIGLIAVIYHLVIAGILFSLLSNY